MSFEVKLRGRVKSWLPAGSTASVEWGKRPQGRFPAIVLTTVALPVERHMTGANGWRRARVQIDVMALDKATVVTLREAIVAGALQAETVGGVQFGAVQGVSIADLSEDADGEFVFRDMIDAIFWHAAEN